MITPARSVTSRNGTAPRKTVLAKTWHELLVIVTGLAFFVLCLPVALLFSTTSVPLLLALVLWVLDLKLLHALPRPHLTGVKRAGIFTALGIFSILAVYASQFYAATPPITDYDGTVVSGSIATLERVNLNGSEQWVTIRGKNAKNPVLLNLGTGIPGTGGLTSRPLAAELETYFVVVNWDFAGSGKSYAAASDQSPLRDNLIRDAYALTRQIQERFHQDKIYVYASGWTTILGIWLVEAHPEEFYAYVGDGQIVNTSASDCKRYELALLYAADCGDTAAVKRLQKNGPPPYSGQGLTDKYFEISNVIDDYLGAPHTELRQSFAPLFLSEYGFLDKANHLRSMYESFQTMYPQLQDVDLTTQAARLDVPIYLLVEPMDAQTDIPAIERYLKLLQAPHKEIIWLKNSHRQWETERMSEVAEILVERVLPPPIKLAE